MPTAEERLVAVLDAFGATIWDNEIVAACPICQPDEAEISKYRMAINCGSKYLAVCFCRKCGNNDYENRYKEWWFDVASHYNLSPDCLVTESEAESRRIWASLDITKGKKKKQPAATIDKLDTVYNDLLHRLTLSEKHQNWLQKRGVDPNWAMLAGYRSTEEVESKGQFQFVDLTKAKFKSLLDSYSYLEKVPGFSRIGSPKPKIGLRSDSILIPSRNPQGKIQAIKQRIIDGKGARMRWLASAGENAPAVVNSPHYPLKVGSKKHPELWITEGERKADCHYLLTEKPTVGISGTGCYKQITTILDNCLQSGGKVVLAFDKDAAGVVATSKVADIVSGVGVPVEIADWTEAKGIDDAVVKEREVVTRKFTSSVNSCNNNKSLPAPTLKLYLKTEEEVVSWLKSNGPTIRSAVPAAMGVVAKLLNRQRIKFQYTDKGQILFIKD